MANSSVIESFTTNEEIDNWIESDNNIVFKGFIDSIEGIKDVGKSSKKLFKVIVNNGKGRRVRILFCADFALQYSSKVVTQQIIEVSCARSSRLNTTYLIPGQNLSLIELSIMPFTSIILGASFNEVSDELEYERTTIRDILIADERVEIQAYVKIPFYLINTNAATYGSGLIADDRYRLRIHIANFIMNDMIHIGSCIRIKGAKRFDHLNHVYLQVRSSDDITLLNEPDATPEELRRAVLNPSIEEL